jgi:hypothetical protein
VSTVGYCGWVVGTVWSESEAREWWDNSIKKRSPVLGRKLCEKWCKLRWIAVKILGFIQGSVVVRAGGVGSDSATSVTPSKKLGHLSIRRPIWNASRKLTFLYDLGWA